MKIIIKISLSLLLGLPAVLGRRQSSLDWRTRGRVEVARCHHQLQLQSGELLVPL